MTTKNGLNIKFELFVLILISSLYKPHLYFFETPLASHTAIILFSFNTDIFFLNKIKFKL